MSPAVETSPRATYSWRPCRNTVSISGAPTPSGTRRPISVILGKPLTGGGDKPGDAMLLRPRDVERELHPRLPSDDLDGGAAGRPPVCEKLPGPDVGDGLRLIRIENDQQRGAGRLAAGREFDLAQPDQGPGAVAAGQDPVPIGGNEVPERLLDGLSLHRNG